jgi:methyltransferase-like protein
LRCEWITIENAVCLQLLPCLDGSRNHTALLDLLNEWVQSGKLSINIKSQQAGKRVTLNEEQKREILGKILDDVLRLMAKAGLLIA